MHADSHTIELQGLKLKGLGGEFEGNISLADFERYKLEGNLRNLDIETVARSLGKRCRTTVLFPGRSTPGAIRKPRARRASRATRI